MHTSISQRFLIPLLLAFALGFGLAWAIRTPEPATAAVPDGPPGGAGRVVAAVRPVPMALPAAPGASALPASAPAPAALFANADLDQLWRSALAPGDRRVVGYEAEDRLRRLAQTNPAARRRLIGLYDTARTTQERDLLKATLATVQTPDMAFFAQRLANSSDTADRLFGFDMLRSVAPDAPETRALVRRMLATEQSPELLLAALSTLRSGAADPDEAAQLVAQLATLSQHADPAVRGRSIAQLAVWDRSGASGARLAQAMTDSAPEVRQAAVFALAQASVLPPDAKERLLAVAGNSQESRNVRGSALQVLERLPLSREEYAEFARLRGQMGAM